jgi:N-sulfoglucosamine sulfohydrolase
LFSVERHRYRLGVQTFPLFCRTVVSCILFLSAAVVASGAEQTRPNILWLVAEDFGQHLSTYGVKEVWTPNIDKLGRDGMRFDRFFTTAPVCSASRSAFMTGMYQTTIGAQNHRSHRDDGYTLPAGVRVLTDWLRDGGYFTANLRMLPQTMGFRGTAKTDWNFNYSGKPFDSDKWADLKTNQPFYAQLNFSETHRAFKAPKRADPAKVEVPPYEPDHPITRKDWAEYLDAATELDRKVGLVLKQLEADGLADNTIVVFFGDNGQAHIRGKQFCYDEGLLVPLMIRWPSKVAAPKQFKAGSTNSQLIEAIDLAATTLDLAGIAKPAKMQGRSFMGAHAEPAREYAFGARDRCDETVFRFRTVRDARYRYIRNFTPERPFLQPNQYKAKQYPTWNLLKELHAEHKLTPAQEVLCQPTMPEEELYDIEQDRWQTNNLAKSPAHQDTRKKLQAVLEKWIEESNDQGKQFEPAEVVRREGKTT